MRKQNFMRFLIHNWRHIIIQISEQTSVSKCSNISFIQIFQNQATIVIHTELTTILRSRMRLSLLSLALFLLS